MEAYEMEPYVDKSYNEERAKYILTEKLLVVVVAIIMICSYWVDVDSPNFIVNNMTKDQYYNFMKIICIIDLVLRFVGLFICIADIIFICKNQRECLVVILTLSWFIVRPFYFFIRGVILNDDKAFLRGAIESTIFGIILFANIFARIDNFLSSFIF